MITAGTLKARDCGNFKTRKAQAKDRRRWQRLGQATTTTTEGEIATTTATWTTTTSVK